MRLLSILLSLASLAAAGDPQAEPLPDEKVRARLSATALRGLDWSGGERTVEKALADLRAKTGLPIRASAKAAGKKGKERVRLDVGKLDAERALGLLTERHGLHWRVRKGGVDVILRSEIDQKPVLRIYAVADLLPQAAGDAKPADRLARRVRQEVVPWSWREIEGAQVRPQSRVLVVMTIPDVHAELGRFLHEMRKRRQPPRAR